MLGVLLAQSKFMFGLYYSTRPRSRIENRVHHPLAAPHTHTRQMKQFGIRTDCGCVHRTHLLSIPKDVVVGEKYCLTCMVQTARISRNHSNTPDGEYANRIGLASRRANYIGLAQRNFSEMMVINSIESVNAFHIPPPSNISTTTPQRTASFD